MRSSRLDSYFRAHPWVAVAVVVVMVVLVLMMDGGRFEAAVHGGAVPAWGGPTAAAVAAGALTPLALMQMFRPVGRPDSRNAAPFLIGCVVWLVPFMACHHRYGGQDAISSRLELVSMVFADTFIAVAVTLGIWLWRRDRVRQV